MSSDYTPIDAPETEWPEHVEQAVPSKGHSHALIVISGARIFERAAYYGFRALLVLYMVRELSFDDAKAFSIYGSFVGAIYFLGPVGGLLADLWLGSKRMLLWTGYIVILGLLVLLGGAEFFIPGLILFTIGAGLYAPNSNALLAKSYFNREHSLDSAFTINYLGLNLGALLGTTVIVYFADTKGYFIGISLAAATMFIGQLVLMLGNKHISVEDDIDGKLAQTKRSLTLGTIFLVLAALLVNVVLWLFYDLGASKMLMWLDEVFEPSALFSSIHVVQFVNPLVVLVAGIVLALLWIFLRIPTAIKLAIGVLFFAAGYAFLLAPQPSFSALISVFVLHSFGELFFVPILVALMAKHVPVRWIATMMGVLIVSFSLSNFLGQQLAIVVEAEPGSDFFRWAIGILAFLAAGLVLLWWNVRREAKNTSVLG